MELTKLYVLMVRGEKHFFASEVDRNYAFNVLTRNGLYEWEEYEVDLKRKPKKFSKNA